MSTFEGQVAGWLYPPGNGKREAFSNGDSGQRADGAAVAAARSGATFDSVAPSCDAVLCDLVEQYSPSLYRVAFSVTRNSAEAEDAVQETFLRVLKNKDKLAEIRNIRVWLVRITWNVVLDRKRRSKVRPETDDLSDVARTLPCKGLGAESATIAAEGYRRILALIEALPRKEREALLLSAVEELSTAEIAAVLLTSESSVRSRLFRARQSLGKLLQANLAPRATKGTS